MPVPGFGEIAEQLRRATVQVSAGKRGRGSGVIVRPEGVIVTNAHVAAARPISVQFWDGTRAGASLAIRDGERDLAILRVARAGLPAAALADSNAVGVGELVIAIGNPLGFQGALTTGVVHGIGRVPGLGGMKWIQSDARLAPGNSGGPLADARGQVIGINTMVAGGIGLAIPSNSITRLLAKLEGGIAGAPLGVVLKPVEIRGSRREQFGLMILEVAKGSAAEQASLKAGDVLIGAEGRALESLEDLERALDGSRERPWEKVVRLHFLRRDDRNGNYGASTRITAVRLGAPPGARAAFLATPGRTPAAA